jgi:hypothetical protein
MPKVPIDFSKTIIYKIEHIEDDNLVYVGHTTCFDKRRAQHKRCSKNENDRRFNLKLYQMIRSNGGFEMFKMLEVEKYPCNDKREAERRENEVMKELKANLNSIKSFRTEEELKDYYKEYNEVHYKHNKEKIKDRVKEYSEKNKEKNKEKGKEYRELNKDDMKDYQKKYRVSNKDKRKEYGLLNTTKIKEQQKQYYELNKDIMKEKNKEYCELIKDKIKEKRKIKYQKEKKEKKN